LEHEPAPQTDIKRCIIIGAGIAGLTLALALEKLGIPSLILEKSDRLEEAGAGLQLSPNATSILANLGVLEDLLLTATMVQSIDLMIANTSKPLLALATTTFTTPSAPFLALHRADLQAALLRTVMRSTVIELQLGASFAGQHLQNDCVEVRYHVGSTLHVATAYCLIGADGVWSVVRQLSGGVPATYSGYVAYRQTIERSKLNAMSLSEVGSVKAFVSPNAHLVAYPISQGKSVNLVFIAKQKRELAKTDITMPLRALQNFAPELVTDLTNHIPWTTWPLYTVNPKTIWQINARTVLIGDAAHAMLPFGAQGAAMAIEDAYTLAHCFNKVRTSVASALEFYEKLRRSRIKKVVQRGKLNALAYHASGPIASARNLVFDLKGQSLMTDLSWLYAYRAPDIN
jgi:salicylate hydroxylase